LRFGVCLANFGTYSDPRASVRVAQAAEAAGWDGFFLWDHLAFVWGPPSADPWVTLAAVASSTNGLTLGTAVTPLARRRPQVVAQQLASLDALNGGRVVFGAGLGGRDEEFTAFGEDADPHARARMLDAGLERVRSLWPGPVWIGGNGEKALRRAARWDGWVANSVGPTEMTMSPDELAAKADAVAGEVACNGYSSPHDAGLVAEYADAGATWWLENFHDRRCGLDDVLARVSAGSPST
jgi:alkanesulfonate monooxygenase SsuD/methylene tetrahydromethanopterin reductase-like flavin-dependent oxidoreductase (luciferase family)